MARFDPMRPAPPVISLEPATDKRGIVVGYYLKLGDEAGGEVYMPEDFVRSHFTSAPATIQPTPAPAPPPSATINTPPAPDTTGAKAG